MNLTYRLRRAYSTLPAVAIGMMLAFCIARAQPYSAGMISYWKFDDGTATDVLGANPGAFVGAPVVMSGKVGQALLFDGVDDGILVQNSPSLNPTSITLEVWVKYLSYQTSWFPRRNMLFDKRIVDVGSYDLDYNGYRDPGNTGGWESDLNINGAWAIFIQGLTDQLPRALWYHVVLTFDGTTVKMYQNGVIQKSWPRTGALVATNTPLLLAKPGHPLDSHSHALLDEAAIYNRALTSTEVRMHYLNGLNGIGYLDHLVVSIDIKPGGTVNPINRSSRGKVPVAILSSATFDAALVDVSMVRFAGAAATDQPPAYVDVNGDGLMDLVLHFETQDLVLADGAMRARLTGRTLDGMPFGGVDSVKLVK